MQDTNVALIESVKQRPDISPADDEDRAVATITMAFSNDPVARWAFRDADLYLKYWPPFVKAFGGAAFWERTADSIDGCSGVALWLPPGVGPNEEAMVAIGAEAVPAAYQDEVFRFWGEAVEIHPTKPHWYLPLMGVDVTKQGRGYGSALLRHALKRCDRDRLPGYLEATNPLNKRLYERHGFEEVGVIQVGSSPPMWPMHRKPR